MRHVTNITHAATVSTPVTLSEAKDHVRVMSDDFDSYIQTLIEAATEYCERCTGRPLRVPLDGYPSSVTQKYPGWPTSPVELDWQPAGSITSITYFDTDDASQTVSSSNYRLLASANAGALLEFDEDFTEPATSNRSDAVTITYGAGYTTASSVPAAAKHAIKLLVGHWFEHAEAVMVGGSPASLPLGVDALLESISWGRYR